MACGWSSHATSGSRGRNRPSRRISITSVKRQLPGPVGSTSRDARSCFCRSWACQVSRRLASTRSMLASVRKLSPSSPSASLVVTPT
jgi:hypothetical protein